MRRRKKRSLDKDEESEPMVTSPLKRRKVVEFKVDPESKVRLLKTSNSS